jgi:uncharacterized protein DUF2800
MDTKAGIASGRFDRLTIHGSTALIQDFKSGFSDVNPAEYNAQLKFLAVAVAIEHKQLTKVIVQLLSPKGGVSEHVYSLENGSLQKAYIDVVNTIDAINNPRAPFHAGEEQCRYCPASNICEEVKKLVGPVSKERYSQLPDGERAAKLLGEIEVLSAHILEIRRHYEKRMRDDSSYQIPGWTLEVGAPRRKVTDWVAARAKLEEFVNQQELDALADFSIPAVEKLLGDAIGVRGNKLKDELKRVLGELLVYEYPQPTLKKRKKNGDPIRRLES